MDWLHRRSPSDIAFIDSLLKADSGEPLITLLSEVLDTIFIDPSNSITDRSSFYMLWRISRGYGFFEIEAAFRETLTSLSEIFLKTLLAPFVQLFSDVFFFLKEIGFPLSSKISTSSCDWSTIFMSGFPITTEMFRRPGSSTEDGCWWERPVSGGPIIDKTDSSEGRH